MDTPTIIKHYRGSLSLRKFAETLGVSHAAVQQWESGATEPTDKRIYAFITSQDDCINEMGKASFLARNGETIKTLIKAERT